jgi:hypothetical protein
MLHYLLSATVSLFREVHNWLPHKPLYNVGIISFIVSSKTLQAYIYSESFFQKDTAYAFLLEKPTVAQSLKKFPEYYGT